MKRWVLASPVVGRPQPENFALIEEPIGEPAPGQVQVQLSYHTVAPGVRAKLSGKTYTDMVRPGETIPGMGVGLVTASNHSAFPLGALVSGELGWATDAVVSADKIRPLDRRQFVGIPLHTALTLLGPTGLTAYFGLTRVAEVRAGEVLLISAAAGAVGVAAGQMARLLGCRVVGLAGSEDKCRELIQTFGFDAVINYRRESDLDAAIALQCPNGVDVYFDNVGGAVTDAAIRGMAQDGRIAVCGQVSEYSASEPRGWRETGAIVSKRLRIRGFVLFDFAAEFASASHAISRWIETGALVDRPTVIEGVENAADAFVSMFGDHPPGRVIVSTGASH
jgi:NADPH-dependent curcumin reductase CurA